MKAREVRSSFLEFFKRKGHTIVPSASVIPHGDETLLFVNAGMAPFKDIFLGFKEPKHLRLVDTQKCIRVSGKHNDLEEVGIDTYHHTFFEMLGNWSFGDYYKKEAILYAWELLTGVWKLPKERLFVTYFHEDAETRDLWKSLTDVNPNYILPFGEKHNFWEMGKTGPCGPCTEIHYYRGEDPNFTAYFNDAKRGVNGEDGAFMEIWNLVFMQSYRDEKGDLHPLAKKHVDTGMGFERIVAVLQEKDSNYDTDLFQGIVNSIERLSGKSYEGEYCIPMRVIADHIRTIVFSLSDGVLPTNEGRGYVIRRILRRALRYGLKLDFKEPFLYRLVDAVKNEYDGIFKEVSEKIEEVRRIVKREEELFLKTLERGMRITEKKIEELKKIKESVFPGETAFLLYDTYGFPLDLTSLIVREEGLSLDELGFKKAMDFQKKRSATQKKSLISPSTVEGMKLFPQTLYLGDAYDEGAFSYTYKTKGKLLKIFQEKEDIVLLFDQTVFYGESGGQVGDSGLIKSLDGSLQFSVKDVQIKEGYILHFGEVIYGELKEGEEYRLIYDLERRKAIRKNHSAVHLLHYALRELLGKHVQQRGSYVDEKKARLDFSHTEAVNSLRLKEIENEVNAMIAENYPIEIIENVPYEKAVNEMKALAFFEEKYPEKVRVVSIAGKSVELCGGSHARSTGEIGLFKVASEGSSSAGVRRIEILSGSAVYDEIEKKDAVLKRLGQFLRSEGLEDLEIKLEKHIETLKNLEEKIQSEEEEKLNEIVRRLKPQKFGQIEFFYQHLDKFSNTLERFREKIEAMKNGQTKRIIVFSLEGEEGKINFFCGVTKDLEKEYPAGTLVKGLATICGGNGGGRADCAFGAGKDASKLKEALDALKASLILN